MKTHRRLIFLVLGILLTSQLLFGHVPPGHAQDDQSWTEPVNLSFSGIAANPSLVIDFKNVLHAVWVDEIDGYKYSQSADGFVWTKPQTVNFAFDKEGSPPVLLSGTNGLIHAFWLDAYANLFYGETTALDLANPSNWQITTRLARDVSDFAVVEDSRGVLHLVFIDKTNSVLSPAGVYYRQSLVGGGSWTGFVKLYESDYFRSAKSSESFISIATAISASEQKVYVTWDSRPQKRIFMAVSENGGLNWGEAQQIKGPQDTSGPDTPFNPGVAALENKLLFVWQVGEPGTTECSAFSQWSEDAGKSWEDVVTVLDGRRDCPTSVKFAIQDENYIVAMMRGQGEPTLKAWDGAQWSEPQVQTQLPAFASPVTFDPVLLGCRFDLIHQGRLYVVGCDHGSGGDVWFLSRSLQPLQTWFTPPSIWGVPVVISEAIDGTEITNLASVADRDGKIHVVWIETLSVADSRAIRYARWNGKDWAVPDAALISSGGTPTELSVTIDNQQRLHLAWVDEKSGDLYFNWADLDKTNLAPEWKESVGLPSVSNLTSTPHILVDGSGRIVVGYAVSINEERGVYVVQSTDGGRSWFGPMQVFDAGSAAWERVEDPRICLGAEGILHATFIRKATRDGQSTGLYYSRSLDGGATWSDAQLLGEGQVNWSDLICYDASTVQILWQEYDGLVYANLSRSSDDGGESWSRSLNVTGVSESPSPVSVASNGLGQLHLVQIVKENDDFLIKQDNLLLRDWNWTGSRWDMASESPVIVMGEGISYAVTSEITRSGFLVVSVLAEYYDHQNELSGEIQTFSRFLAKADPVEEAVVAAIPASATPVETSPVPGLPPTEPVDLSILHDDNVPTTSTQRSMVGLAILGAVGIVTIVLFVHRRPRSAAK